MSPDANQKRMGEYLMLSGCLDEVLKKSYFESLYMLVFILIEMEM